MEEEKQVPEQSDISGLKIPRRRSTFQQVQPMRFRGAKLSFLLPIMYAVVAALLLNLPMNSWLALHIFYVISWPSSHVFASEPLLFESGFGVLQWIVIGLLVDKFRRPNPTP